MGQPQSSELLNSVSDAFMAMGANLVVTFFNDAAETMRGRKREEILGKPLFDSFPEARGSIFEINYRRALDEKCELCFETFFELEPYRDWYDVRVYPTENGICVFFRVQSELRKLEIGLRKINNCLLLLGNDYSSSVSMLTQAAGEVMNADFAVYRALKGHSLSAVGTWNMPNTFLATEAPQGKLCAELLFRSEESHMLVADLQDSDIARMDPAIKASGMETYLGHVIKAGDIRIGVLCVCYKTNVSPTEDDLELIKIIASALGNVEMHREKEQLLVNSNKLLQDAMDHLNDAQDEIIKRERLSALGQMVSGIAHDFNNALMPIMGISDLLLDSPELMDDKVQLTKDMEMIHQSASLAADTVKSLREFYRPMSEEDFTTIRIGELIKGSVKATEHAWKVRAMDEERPIEMRVATGMIPETTGNQASLQDVLSNLILNSVDAMPQGGIITVRGWYEDDHIYVSVRDTGVGMSEDVRAHCLEPFFTTKYSTGTGMGLARSYGIVTRRGGTITVDSAPDRGTEVIVKLIRRVPDAEVERSDAAGCSDEGKTLPLSILVVDDDERTRYLIQKLLQNQTQTLTICAGGVEALEKFREIRHALVITDKAMPEMNGEELAEKVKRIAPDTPILMLTGYGDLMGENGCPSSVDFLLGKPITKQQLYEAIEAVTAGPKGALN